MSQLLPFLMLTIGAFLATVGGTEDYDKLPDVYKKGVELVLVNLHSTSNVQQYFRFFKTLSKTRSEVGFNAEFVNHHFYLKATVCGKKTVKPTPQSCPFRNDRPLMDCTVCYKSYMEMIEEKPTPYVACDRRTQMTEDKMKKRQEVCQSLNYSVGSFTLLGVRT